MHTSCALVLQCFGTGHRDQSVANRTREVEHLVPNESRETYVLIPEMDAAILEHLPKQGAKIGLKPLGKQVKALSKDLGESGNAISGRMGTLRKHGFAVDVVVQPVGHGKGYQITPRGEEFVRTVKDGSFDSSKYTIEGS